MRHIHTVEFAGQYPVTLEQHKSGLFRVQYGKQVRSSLSYGAAAREFGECVMHAATCAGLTDVPEQEG